MQWKRGTEGLETCMLTIFVGVAKLIRMGLSIKTQKRQTVEKKGTK